MSIVNIENFRWWLSLVEPSTLEDNQFEKLSNFSYNKDKRVQTRRWIKNFGNSIGSSPITSYFFYQDDSTWDRTALCTAGTNMYEYNEWTWNWSSIKSWLTEFEADWVTRTRWSFAVYKNIVYMCNGIDDYASYNPATSTYTTYATQPPVRYLKFMWERLYWAWDDSNPISLYYTAALPADWSVLNTNVLVVWWDELWVITWLLDLWQIILAFKEKKVYSINVAWSIAEPLDAQNGWYCHRAIKNVENSIIYYNDAWVDTLKPRSWLSWASALATEPLANDLRSLLDNITAKQRNTGAGWYDNFINNYYYSFDTTNDSIPDKTIVYSSLVWAWSEYLYPSFYDYWFYIDSDWVKHLLAASANWGQMFEIETWFQDFWLAIPTELKTKRWDFKDITTWKTFDSVDIIGLKNEWSEITVEIIVDWEVVASSLIDDWFINFTDPSLTLWWSALWTEVIWGWTWDEWESIDLYRYLIRIPLLYSGPDIQVRMYSESNPNIRTLDKIKINYKLESFDLFSVNNIW